MRWLFRGRVVSRIFELRQEIELFFIKQRYDEYKLMLIDLLWLQILAYLSDISTKLKLNELNFGLILKSCFAQSLVDFFGVVLKMLNVSAK